MSARTRAALLATALLLSACGEDEERGAPEPETPDQGADAIAAEYKGYAAVNELLRSRLIATPGFELWPYLGENGYELAELLGTWDGLGKNNRFRNGAPNGVSFLLWSVAFEGLGGDLAAMCPGATGAPVLADLTLHPEVAGAFSALCAWPEPSARSEAALAAVWEVLVAADAPPAAYEPFRDRLLSDAFAGLGPDLAIPAVISEALLNPYFLLQN